MPHWGGILSAEQLRALVAYIEENAPGSDHVGDLLIGVELLDAQDRLERLPGLVTSTVTLRLWVRQRDEVLSLLRRLPVAGTGKGDEAGRRERGLFDAEVGIILE